MAVPSMPSQVYVQQGNGQVFISWNITAGATAYDVYRSTNGTSFSVLASPSTNNYLDTAVTVGTQYWYKVAATNADGSSVLSSAQSVVPAISGSVSLGQIRLMAQQRADRVNSNFVTLPEWNSYINQSYMELYDLLTTVYEDYHIAEPFIFQTNGDSRYELPNGTTVEDINGDVARPFYKLVGVDCGLALNDNGWISLGKFDFIQRNAYVYPNIAGSQYGIFNMRYRLMGSELSFIPTPSSGQYIRLWYIPRLEMLLKDTDLLDGVSGWSEYVIVDAAIKALQKEESDVSVLLLQKQALIDRIQTSAMNRDAGQPDTISDTRSWWSRNGGEGGF
jgi:hypothetical protein